MLLCSSQVHNITTEVSLMFKAAGGPESIGKFTALSLLDWYYLDKEIILVMERPVPFVNFKKYLVAKGGAIKEEEAKVLKCVCLQNSVQS